MARHASCRRSTRDPLAPRSAARERDHAAGAHRGAAPQSSMFRQATVADRRTRRGRRNVHAARGAEAEVARCRACSGRPAEYRFRHDTRAASPMLGWQLDARRIDVFDFLDAERHAADVVVANLFLHHFPDGALARLLRAAARLAPTFVACEPRRSLPALAGSKLLFAIGCNDVSRHDAVASVRAGFSRERALAPLAGPRRLASCTRRSPGPSRHSFAASRA